MKTALFLIFSVLLSFSVSAKITNLNLTCIMSVHGEIEVPKSTKRIPFAFTGTEEELQNFIANYTLPSLEDSAVSKKVNWSFGKND